MNCCRSYYSTRIHEPSGNRCFGMNCEVFCFADIRSSDISACVFFTGELNRRRFHRVLLQCREGVFVTSPVVEQVKDSVDSQYTRDGTEQNQSGDIFMRNRPEELPDTQEGNQQQCRRAGNQIHHQRTKGCAQRDNRGGGQPVGIHFGAIFRSARYSSTSVA